MSGKGGVADGAFWSGVRTTGIECVAQGAYTSGVLSTSPISWLVFKSFSISR